MGMYVCMYIGVEVTLVPGEWWHDRSPYKGRPPLAVCLAASVLRLLGHLLPPSFYIVVAPATGAVAVSGKVAVVECGCGSLQCCRSFRSGKSRLLWLYH